MRRAAPAYQAVQHWLREGIDGGRWRQGDRLPSEAELVARFGVARMTVNRALRELEQQGLVRRVQGSGSFVAPLERLAATLEVRDVHAQIAARGRAPASSLLALRAEPAPEAVARTLGLRRGARAFFSQMLHREDGQPLQLESRWVHPARAPAYLAQDFGRLTPTAYLLAVAPLAQAEVQIEAMPATADEALQLALAPGEACLVVQRLTRGAAGPVSWARLVHPGARFVLHGVVRP